MKKDKISIESAFPSALDGEGGLTKREYFAVQLMPAFIFEETACPATFPDAADSAVTAADALIERLSQ